MGQEIDSSHFTQADFADFNELLKEETKLLGDLLSSSAFDHADYKGGFELEGWLLNLNKQVAPKNNQFLNALNSPYVVPELAKFNFEVNGHPQLLQGKALSQMHEDMQGNWSLCQNTAEQNTMSVLMTGILPNLLETDLCLTHMSDMTRYAALNQQVLKMRNYEPLHLHICGKDTLDVKHNDVMLEAASTSFQIHFQVPIDQSVSHYNAAIISSAPMVAISANSPFLFGHDLWDETRIPLFEQSVEVGQPHHRRVSFGQAYVKESLYECFEENLWDFPVLVPMNKHGDTQQLTHLRFHNGTIWRWNRPLIDFNDQGQPRLRIEHRVVPAGPSVLDNMANAALFFGMCHTLAKQGLEKQLLFKQAKKNFYSCAKQGLKAQVEWPGFDQLSIFELLQQHLVPMAREGLQDMQLDQNDIDHFISVIEKRLDNQQNGANWQRRWVEKHGHDMQALCVAYSNQQSSMKAVHEWEI